MPNHRLIVRYDGTGLSGWQRQRGVPTVQEALEDAAATIAGERITVRGAGRTDAGVHALAQVASFRTRANVPDKGWRLGLTAKLPPQVAVLDVRTVRDDYDPRRAAAGKRYRYLLLASPIRDPLLRDRAWHVWGDLDLARMRREAAHLPGTHDFAAFRAADCERETTRRHIFSVDVVAGWANNPDLIAVEVVGTAFLKNMVRIIVGTLVDVARDRLPEGTVPARLADGDRTRGGMTAPPQGLYLDEVFQRPEWLLPDDVLRPGPGFPEGHPVAGAPAATETDENDE
ncbi:MAG: tRNA pseudouridine(38-40) synthase TruA [Polyangiales bacterium]